MKALGVFISVILMAVLVQSQATKHPHGNQIQLTFKTFPNGSIGYDFDKKGLEEIMKNSKVKDKKVYVLSIIGAYRKGKSFFLDYCLRFLYASYKSINTPQNDDKIGGSNWWGPDDEPLSGFSWSTGSNPNTKGILIWNDVFYNDDTAIFVMDTQGLFELNGNANMEARIFGITTFLSSLEIFNLNDVIQENQLEYLKVATDFSRLALLKHATRDSKPFQKLMMLVRDWTDDDVGYGSDGARHYMQRVLKTVSSNPVAQQVRRSLNESYDEISAFLLPAPGKHVKKQDYDGRWSELDKDFQLYLKELIPKILGTNGFVRKKFFGKEVTAGEMMGYIEPIFAAFQSPKLPDVNAMFNAVVEGLLRGLVDRIFQEYKLKLNSIDDKQTNFLDTIDRKNEQFRQQLMNEFKKADKMNDKNAEKKYKALLEKQMKEFYKEWKETKKEIRKHYNKINDNENEMKNLRDEMKMMAHDLKKVNELQNSINALTTANQDLRNMVNQKQMVLQNGSEKIKINKMIVLTLLAMAVGIKKLYW